MERKLTRRRGGPSWNMFMDLLADAWWTRNWFITVVLLLCVVAAMLAFVGQTVLPWAIYPAL
jgi:hypothetical protein